MLQWTKREHPLLREELKQGPFCSELMDFRREDFKGNNLSFQAYGTIGC